MPPFSLRANPRDFSRRPLALAVILLAATAPLACGGGEAGSTTDATGSASGQVAGSGSDPAASLGGDSATESQGGGAGTDSEGSGGAAATGNGGATTTSGGTESGTGGTATGGETATGGSGAVNCDATCDDVPPDDLYSCEEQAGWGKCGETWMQDYCRTSCGDCVPCTGNTGGAASSGGSTGSGGASNSGGSTGSIECDVQPANPNATVAARNLLCYLYQVYGQSVLSGQQETSWNSNPNDDVEWINSNTGDYPAVLGGDYLYPNGTTDRAIQYWNSGGIPMIRYHMGAPPLEDTYENSQGVANIAAVLTEGSTEYQSFMAKLDYVADELQRLEDAGAAVLWAPFHESQPNGWFWWSKGTGAELVALWRLMFDYYTNTRGVDNVIWLMPFSGAPNSAFYPGDAYVDLAGPDTYETNQPFASMFSATQQIVGTTRPIPLHETGTIPNPDDMFNNNAAPWVLFSVWAGYQISENSLSAIQTTYSNARTITRGELPNLR